MRVSLLLLALLLTSHAQAQRDPGTLEIAERRLDMPNLIWPSLLTAAGAATLGGALWGGVSTGMRQPAPVAGFAVLGGAALASGIVWTTLWVHKRRPLEQQIAQRLDALRSATPLEQRPLLARTLQDEQPSLQGPIWLSSAAIFGTLAGTALLGTGMALAAAENARGNGLMVAGAIAITAGFGTLIPAARWWRQRRQLKRAYGDRIETLQRVDLAGAPFMIRW